LTNAPIVTLGGTPLDPVELIDDNTIQGEIDLAGFVPGDYLLVVDPNSKRSKSAEFMLTLGVSIPGSDTTDRSNMQPYNTVNFIIAVREGSSYPSVRFAGEITMYVGTSAPLGWMFCDGQSLEAYLYPDLWQAIGTTYGSGSGPGVTFALPDLRGRSPIHEGAGPGLTPRTLGGTGGTEVVTDRY
jgi:microcystin-dependent protein